MERKSKAWEGEASPAQLALWKQEYGEIFTAKSDRQIAYFRKPSRQELCRAMSLRNDRFERAELILKACFISGSDIFLHDADYWIGTEELVGKLLEAKKVELNRIIDEANGSKEHNQISYADTMMQYYLHIDPSSLDDAQWAEKLAQLVDIRNSEG